MVGEPQKGLPHLDSNASWESRSPHSVQDVRSMTLPPGKRQRRLILSDDDEPAIKTRRAPPRLSSGAVTSLPDRKSINQNGTPKKSGAKSASKASPKSSPEKANKLGGKVERASKSLHTFFGRATEEQRWARKDKTPPNVVEDGEAGDDIQDDSLDEALAELPDPEGNENRILDRRKPPKPALVNGVSKPIRDVIGSGQKFAKPSKPAAKEAKAVSGLDDDLLNRPWAERFAPTSLEELAVHKKKVIDVQNWLSAVLRGRDRRRLLVLKGPAGSGKSTTVSLLAKAMNFDISEWRSPTVAATGINSFSSQFDDFLNRVGAFGALDILSGMPQNKDSGTAMQGDPKERILLVEEFPSTMTLSSSALSSFRNVLLQYLAAAVPPRSAVFEQSKKHLTSHPPIVLVISESLLTSATASTDSFTAHRLLGPDLSNHPYATIVEFNAVAPTLVTKALELAIKKEARVSQRRRVPGPAVLKRLSELGDVRSAVNGLEFLCVRGDADSDWGGRTAAKKTKSNKSMTNMEKESLELVTQREATLGIFHAVGKVVWNKREDPRIAHPEREPLPEPPDHMPTFDRPKVSQVETDELLNEIGTDVQTFTAALHENYVLSTNGSHFYDSASACIDILSESDLLSPSSRQTTRSSRPNPGSGGAMMQAGGVDMLRQNEISFQVAVLGLLFSLPHPVSRASHPNGRKGDSFKMFYPASLKIWKPSEEIHDLLSMEMGRLSASSVEGPQSMPSGARTDGVESWKSRSLSFLPSTQDDKSRSDNETSRVWVTRDELLLERLPFTARMQPGNDRSTRNLKKITQLTGGGVLLNGDEEADADNAEGALDLSAADETTDRVASPQKRVGLGRNLLVGKAVVLDQLGEGVAGVEKLYISEDDIEDD